MSDAEELLMRKKLLELRKRMLLAKLKEMEKEKRPNPYEVFLANLTKSGREVFDRALAQYGDLAKRVGEGLGRLILLGRLKGPLTGELVYGIFLELGLPIRMPTRIVYKRRGEVKTISEMLKEE